MNPREQFYDLIKDNHKFLIIQPDRPDGDSISSALLLEEILEEQGKQTYLYCGVNIPEYMRFIPGWDRIKPEIPSNFDVAILVDDASLNLIEKYDTNVPYSLKAKPFVVIDHHDSVESDIPYMTLNLSQDGFASAGELIYDIFKNHFSISLQAKKYVLQSILSDTMGLTNDLATPSTYRTIADLIEDGVDRAELEEARRELGKMDERVFKYKAQLIERTVLYRDGRVAICEIPESELYDVGTLYNPGPLILGELTMVSGVRVAIALKTYKNRATAAIRCAYGYPVAHDLAFKFGGGGHPYSAGFRVEPFNISPDNLINEILTKLDPLL
jgi:bifunctional oligoribonuclease and PAP phosphatase NrnA